MIIWDNGICPDLNLHADNKGQTGENKTQVWILPCIQYLAVCKGKNWYMFIVLWLIQWQQTDRLLDACHNND